MPVSPENIIQHMQVPDMPCLYILGVFEKRVTIYSQQVRALNLAYSLHATDRLKQGSSVAIVGAGIAGLTASAGVACLGASVTVFEQSPNLLDHIGNSTKRWLHPHIYEWPMEEADLPSPMDPNAQLPIMNWQSGTVSEVRNQLLGEYSDLEQRCGIAPPKLQVTNLKIRKGDTRHFNLTWSEPVNPNFPDSRRSTRRRQFDIVILAVGFGLEKTFQGILSPSYWENDTLDEVDMRIRRRAKRILISGTGDGGLIDVLRCRIKGFRHDTILRQLIEEWLKKETLNWLVPELQRIEKEALSAERDNRPYAATLNEAYQEIGDRLKEQNILANIPLRPDTRVIVTSLGDDALNLRSSILNRLLYSILPDVEHIQGPWDYQINPSGDYDVTFKDGSVEIFDQIIVRHGPESALSRDFHEMWEKSRRLEDRNILNQTRYPIYATAFNKCKDNMLEQPLLPSESNTTPLSNEPSAHKTNNKPTADNSIASVAVKELGTQYVKPVSQNAILSHESSISASQHVLSKISNDLRDYLFHENITSVNQETKTIPEVIQEQPPHLFHDGLCAGMPLQPTPNEYFVAHEYSRDRDDLLLALEAAFQAFRLMPYRAESDFSPHHILCKIAAKLQTTLFSVFELTRTQNRNVYLELGISVGLRRPSILVKEADAEIPSLVQGLDYYNIGSYASLQQDLGNRAYEYILNISRYSPPKLPPAGCDKTYILAHGDYDMPSDFCQAIATGLASRDLNPLILGMDERDPGYALAALKIPFQPLDNTGKTSLDATVQAIQRARFGIYRVDQLCSPDVFLALGIAIGLNRPWLLVSREGTPLPVDVRGLSMYRFQSFAALSALLPQRYSRFLDMHA